MRVIVVLLAGWLALHSASVSAETAVNAHAPKPIQLKAGSILIRKRLHGFPIQNAVVMIEGPRALIRVALGENSRYEWLDLKAVAADPATYQVLPPLKHPFESVLIPVANGRAAYEKIPVSHLVLDPLGNEILISPSGRLIPIGNHLVTRQKSGDDLYEVQPNIPVERGQNVSEAIDGYNETYGLLENFEPLDPEIRLVPANQELDLATARLEANLYESRSRNCLAFPFDAAKKVPPQGP